jgi:hypothetical protein
VERQLAIYRRLCALYPHAFRAQYEDEMVMLFADQLRDAATRGRWSVVRTWWRCIGDLVVTATGERLRRRLAMTQPEGTASVSIATAPRRLSSTPARVLALAPLWLQLGLTVAIPGFFDSLLDPRASMLGVPAGIVVAAITWLWALVGAAIVWRARHRLVVVLPLLLFTGPALLSVVLAPTLISLVINLGGSGLAS